MPSGASFAGAAPPLPRPPGLRVRRHLTTASMSSSILVYALRRARFMPLTGSPRCAPLLHKTSAATNGRSFAPTACKAKWTVSHSRTRRTPYWSHHTPAVTAYLSSQATARTAAALLRHQLSIDCAHPSSRRECLTVKRGKLFGGGHSECPVRSMFYGVLLSFKEGVHHRQQHKGQGG